MKLLNNHCPELKGLADGPRFDRRMNLTLPLLVVPCEGHRPVIGRIYPALTKELSSTGLSLVAPHTEEATEVVVAIRWEGAMYYLRARIRHCTPLGAGFHQLGLELVEMLNATDYPGLSAVVY